MTNRDEEMRVLHGTAQDTENDLTSTRSNTNLAGQMTQTHLTAEQQGEGEVGRLQLLEERAQVQVLREGVGQVQVRKVLRERQEMVPVTLTTEVLEIVVTPVAQGAAGQNVAGQSAVEQGGAGELTGGSAAAQGVSQILIDGRPLQVGQSYEIPLTEERVQVVKQVYPISEVVIRKQAQTTTHQETVTLRHEELDVVDAQGLARQVDSVFDDETGRR